MDKTVSIGVIFIFQSHLFDDIGELFFQLNHQNTPLFF